MYNTPLRYEISSWDEVPQCLSNNSKHLHLTYDSVMDKQLTGGIVRVQHDKYGCLFAYLVNASGSLLYISDDGTLFELEPCQLLKELEKYGFFIKFEHKFVINDEQFQLLVTASGLGMDKIRIMYVDTPSRNKKVVNVKIAYLVAFKSGVNSKWLSNTYESSFNEFNYALVSGTCVNLTKCKGGLVPPNNWKFLEDKVLNISNVLNSAR